MIDDEIVKWVKKQPYWLQIIANSIFKGDKLDSKSLDKIYILFKQEFRLEKKPLVKSNLDFLISKVLNENFIKGKWESISNVKGVNALKPELFIDFQKTSWNVSLPTYFVFPVHTQKV